MRNFQFNRFKVRVFNQRTFKALKYRLLQASLIALTVASACAPQTFEGKKEAVGEKPLDPICQNGSASCVVNPSQTETEITQTIDVPTVNNKVDILIVMDNSRSMQTEQLNMAARLDSFINALASNGKDWRLAIVSTDMSSNSGTLKGGNLAQFKSPAASGTYFITRDMVQSNTGLIDSFKQTVQMTVDASQYGSGDERPIYAAMQAYRKNQNSWMRSEAQFSVIIVSDEDVRSDGYGYNWYPITPLESGRDYPADLMALVPPSKGLTVHGIVIKPNDQNCLNQQRGQLSPADGYIGNTIARLVDLTSGQLGSVCESDYGSQLANIGQSISSPTIASVALACNPLPKDLPITSRVSILEGSATTMSFVTDGNLLQFNPALTAGTYLKFKYRCATN